MSVCAACHVTLDPGDRYCASCGHLAGAAAAPSAAVVASLPAPPTGGPTSATPEGWYADPWMQAPYRWHDGHAWTERLSDTRRPPTGGVLPRPPLEGSVLALVVGVLVLGGLFVPWVGSDYGPAESMAESSDASMLWFFAASGIAALVGGIAGRAGYRWGIALAAGAGLSFLSVTALMIWFVVQMWELGLSIHVGIVMHGAAALGGLLLATQISSSTGKAHSPPLHPLGVLLGIGGALAWVIGYLVPPVEGADFASSVTEIGDGWLTALVILILAVPALGGLVILAERTAASALFLAGSMTTLAAAWALSSLPTFQESGQQFTVFANGQYAWMTAGLVATALAAVFPLFRLEAMSLPDGRHLPARSPGFAAWGVIACLAILGLGLSSIDGDDDQPYTETYGYGD